MQQFKVFYIHEASYSLEQNTISLHYSFDNSEYFTEQVSLTTHFKVKNNKDSIIKNFLFHISLAFGISYYKLCPTKEIVITSWIIDSQQEIFWKDFYIQWLWEFFYTNNIDFSDLCNFSSQAKRRHEKEKFSLSQNSLLPIWWGKDSIVSSLLLEKEWANPTPFIFWKLDVIKQDFLEIYKKNPLIITRSLDPKLFDMNKQWYYNGHVPITWLISFFMTLVCYLYDYKYIYFSNEKSANTWNTLYKGVEINHQYSKSQDFETKISHYIFEHISEDISYSSILREYYEIEIAKIFAEKWKKYFKVFSSCNKNFSIQKVSPKRWCNNCPKCLFVYIILRSFLTHEETTEIFGEELYERDNLQNLFSEIVWISGIKPFECVWEVEEAQLWCFLIIETWKWELPILLRYFSQEFAQYENKEYISTLKKKYSHRI